MIILRHLLAAALVLGSLCLLPGNARAAQSLDTCAGFIDSLPVTLNTQGVWCLRKDLTTSMTSGNAITIAANNVTIDCNDFKIGGLAAGNASQAVGILATSHQNATVRHCNVRGFHFGIYLVGGAGHLIEDNRLDNNLYTGIYVNRDNNRVQRNRVYDTGGYVGSTSAYGIIAAADVIDNTVAGVFAIGGANTYPTGISLDGSGNEARGNQVRGLAVTGSGYAIGIYTLSTGARFADNHVMTTSLSTATGWGIYGVGAATFCTGNTVFNFATAYSGCAHNFGNLPAP